jgi:hypothetical protein
MLTISVENVSYIAVVVFVLVEGIGQLLLDIVVVVSVLSGNLCVSMDRSLTSAIAAYGAEVNDSGSWLSHLVGWSRGTWWRCAMEDLTASRRGLCDPACRVLLRRRMPVGFVPYRIRSDEVDSTGSSTEDTRQNFWFCRT